MWLKTFLSGVQSSWNNSGSSGVGVTSSQNTSNSGNPHNRERTSFRIDSLTKKLRELFDEYKARIGSQEGTKYLLQFLSTCNDKYMQWNWEFESDSYGSEAFLSKMRSVPALDEEVTKSLIGQLSNYVVRLSKGLTEDDPSLIKDKDLPTVIDFLYLVNVLSRSTVNMQLFMQFKILGYPVQIAKLASLKLNAIAHDPEAFYVWWDYLRVILANCFQIVANFTNPRFVWQRPSADIDPNLQALNNEAKQFAVNLGVMKVLKDVLKFFSNNTVCDTSVQFGFQALVLNTVGGLTYRSALIQSALRDSEILECIVDFIGWKKGTYSNSPETFEKEFLLQLTSLQVIREAIFQSPENSQRMSELGGFEKTMDFILWTSECFVSAVPKTTPDIKLIDIDEPEDTEFVKPFSYNVVSLPPPNHLERPPNKELTLLFQVLYSMCVPSADEGVATASPPTINKGILSILLDLFNVEIRQSQDNTRARDKLKTGCPELQLFALEFFTKLFFYVPDTIQISTSYRIWDVIFSEFFFYCAIPDQSNPYCYLFKGLRVHTLQFIQFVATLEKHDNTEECQKIVETFALKHDDLELVLQTCKCLIKVLTSNRKQTQAVLQNNKALVILIALMERYQTVSDTSAPNAKLFLATRKSLLSLLGHFIADEIVANYVMQDSNAKNVLFALLHTLELQRLTVLNIVMLMKTTPEEANQSISGKLINNFLDLLTKIQPEASEVNFQLVQELLFGVREVMTLTSLSTSSGSTTRKQKLFVEAGAFVKIITVLNVGGNKERLMILCAEVVKTLTFLLSNNNKNKENFRSLIGYDQLRNVILLSTDNRPNRVILNLLFDMLVDGEFALETRFLIQNVDVIILLFQLLPYFGEGDQEFLVDTFTGLARKCTRNQALSCSNHLIYLLLEQIPAFVKMPSLLVRIIGLVELLGTHSITVSELKKLFGLMKTEPGDFRPITSSLLLKAMQNMALERGFGPEAFFDFNGNKSCIILPVIERWPAKGYTFCTWIRVESFSPPNSYQKYEPCIFSMQNQTQGIEVFFSSKLITIHCKLASGKQATQSFNNCVLQEKRWYFLCITHSKPRIGQSEARLYLDGELAHKVSIKYPQLNNLTSCRIGISDYNVASTLRQSMSSSLRDRETSFLGQMGAIYFFEDAISPAQIQGIYELGPNYLGTFQTESLEAEEINSSLFDGTLTRSILMCYNCKACEGKVCLDNTPDKDTEHAKLADVNLCIAKDVKDVIHCLDGIQVLLPLFAQLDQPVNPKYLTKPEIDYSIDPKLSMQVLTLLRDMLSESTTNQEEMLRCHGFSIIGYLLQRVSPGHLTQDFLSIIKSLIERTALPELLEEIFVYLFLDFRLWVYADFDVQVYLLEILNELVLNRTEYFRSIFGVQKILDSMYFFYWEVPDQGALAKEPIYHPVTKECIGRRPSVDQLRLLRPFMLNLVKIIINSTQVVSDIDLLLNFLMVSKDPYQMVELLNTLFELTSNSYVLDRLHATAAIETLLSILVNDFEGVRLSCLRIIGKLILDIPNALANKRKSKPMNDFAAITKIVLTYPFTVNTYNCLLSMLIGKVEVTRPEKLDETTEIKMPGILPTILKPLLGVSDVTLRKAVLMDVYQLLSMNSQNWTLFVQQFGWQTWLYSIMADKTESAVVSGRSLQAIIVDIFKLIILKSLHTEKDGWALLDESVSLLYPFGDRGVLNVSSVLRALYSAILATLKVESQGLVDAQSTLGTVNIFAFLQGKSQEKSVLMVNLVRFSLFVEDFIFYTTTTSPIENVVNAIHKDSSGNWEDLSLAKDLCEVLDLCKLTNIASFNSVEQLSLHKSHRRSGGMQRLIMRLCLKEIDEAICSGTLTAEQALQICFEAIPRIRTILAKELSGTEPESMSPRVGHTVYQILKSIRNGSTNIKETSKAVIPLVKDIFRKFKPVIIMHFKEKQEVEAVEWFSYVSEATIPDIVKSFSANQGAWSKLLQYLESFSKVTEIEENSFSSLISKHRIKSAKRVREQSEALDVQEIATEKKTEAFSQMMHQKLFQTELQRKMAILDVQKEETRNITRNWIRILRSLTVERAPWGNIESQVFWKLDKTENFSRMRMKIKRNYNFKDHAESSIEHLPPDTEKQANNNPVLLSGIKLSVGMEELKEDKIDDVDAEDWSVIPESETGAPPALEEEKTLFSVYCELVKPMNVIIGKLEITPSCIYFRQDRSHEADMSTLDIKDRKWPLDQIREIHLRRYLLRRNAIEIFLADQTNFFLNFSNKDRNKVYTKILSLKPPNLAYSESRTPEEILKKSNLTKRWQMRQISNFDYLMQLNTIAGRTYNDLTQYPVFPWVIADYSSNVIDLNNPATYRDLSKPIGALNPERLESFIERYNSFDDPQIPKFHYGSHYSSAGAVLFYLVRMEPFTSFFLQLQGGKFDHADRMFHSLPQAWWNALHGTSDVKELIPEFFYLPEFLLNSNNFNLGVRQNGVPVNDVTLPPWAKTPEEFIRINREALESEYVSDHLHEWIDLIFGFKQRGRNAIEAYNVFYYLTYEGAVNLDDLEEGQRRATEAQINNFGQTPSQLIRKKPHPKRLPSDPAIKSIFASPKQLQAYFLQVASTSLVYIGIPETNLPSLLYLGVTDRIVTVDLNRIPASHRWLPTTPNAQVSPFTFEVDPLLLAKRKVGLPFASGVPISPSCFDITNDGKVLISCGHWDNSFKLSFVDTSKQIQSIVKHKDVVTCVALAEDGKTLITGSKDTTLMLWKIQPLKSNTRIDETPLHILYGHDDEVTCVAVNLELDIAVSGSKDGSCILHTLRRGKYVRSIFHPKRFEIRLLAVSSQGHIITYSPDDLMLYLYTINGKLITSVELNERLNHLTITRNAEFLITGSEKGTVVIRKLCNLQFVHKFTVNSPICSLAMTIEERHLIVGLKDGKLLIITPKSTLSTEVP